MERENRRIIGGFLFMKSAILYVRKAADPAGKDGEGEQENNRWVFLCEIRKSACKKRPLL
jgi:hypothetical protein